MTQSAAQKLFDSLSPHQQDAVSLVKLSLDCFNSADGTGLFAGGARYNELEQRLPIAAIKSRTIFGFWANLLNGLKWPVPPKYADQRILESLNVSDPAKTLRSLATEHKAIISVARQLHGDDKATRKVLRAELNAEIHAPLDPEFNDSLEGI